MRILLLIVMTIAVLACAGLGLSIAHNNLFSEDAAEADEAAALLDDLGKAAEGVAGELGEDAKAVMDEALGGAEEAASLKAGLEGYKMSGYAGLVLGILSILLLVIAFMKNWGGTAILGLIGIIAAVAFIALCPDMETGEYGGASPRQQAMIFGGAYILAALCAMGSVKLAKPKAG